MSMQTPLAELLRRYTRDKGWSGERLADESGVHRSTIYRWINGEVRKPQDWREVVKVALALELSKSQANDLLLAAHHHAIERLLEGMKQPDREKDRRLLGQWASATPNNLPGYLTRFIGRDDEIIRARELITSARLVTLTGPGGSGKTRLGCQVAGSVVDDFADGVFFVDLAPIRDPSLVIPTIAQVLGVRQSGDRPLLATLESHLRDRQILLLLDNFEQVADAAALLRELLMAAPLVKALVTSRMRLQLTGEHEWPVPPLPLPNPASPSAVVRANSAVTLFAERAQAVNPDFELSDDNARMIAAICARLDGLPLAIELAAGRVKRFRVQRLLEQFPSRLELANDSPRDASRRHETLRATIGWSYALLRSEEQRLFERLGVFAGGCDREAVQTVCALNADEALGVSAGLDALLEHNLLRETSGGAAESRFEMLGTLREFALERLAASGKDDVVRRRHADYCLQIAGSARPYVPNRQQPAWLDRMEREQDNLRTALAFARTSNDAVLAMRMVGAIWPFWHEHGYLGEGLAWIRDVDAMGGDLPAVLRAPVLTGWFVLALNADMAQAAVVSQVSLALCAEARDQRNMAIVLLYQGNMAQFQNKFELARETFQRSLAYWRQLDDPDGIARCLSELALLLSLYEQFAEAKPYFKEALAIYKQHNDAVGIARSWTDRGLATLLQGDVTGGQKLLRRAVAASQRIGANTNREAAILYLGVAELYSGAAALALARLRESLRRRQRNGEEYGIALCLLAVAGALSRLQQHGEAARLAAAAIAVQRSLGLELPPSLRVFYDAEVGLIREGLDEVAFSRAWSEGSAMRMEQAIRIALGS